MLMASDEHQRLFPNEDDGVSLLYMEGVVLSVADPNICDLLLTQESYAENMVTIQEQPNIFRFITDRMLPPTKAIWESLVQKNIITIAT